MFTTTHFTPSVLLRSAATLVAAFSIAATLGVSAGCQSTSSSQAAVETTKTVDAAHTASTQHRYPAMPEAVASFGEAAYKNYVYIYGGHRTRMHAYHIQTVSPQFHRMDMNTGKSWERLPDGHAVQGMNILAHNGYIYRTGGMEPRNAKGEKTANYSINSAARYNITQGKWETLPNLPKARSSHDMAVVNDKLYIFGGWDMNAETGDVWFDKGLVLDLKSEDGTWQEIEQPFVRRALIMANFKDQIYVMGGMDDGNDISLNVDIFDLKTNTWSQGPSLPGSNMNGFSPAAVVQQNQLYVSVFSGGLYKLNDAKDAWELTIQTTPRIVHRMVSHNDDLLILGGASRGQMLDLVETVTINNGKATIDVTPKAPAVKPSRNPHAAAPSPAPVVKIVAKQKVCPVMTGAEVGSKDDQIVQYQGREVRLCCEACLSKWRKDTNAYLLPEHLPQLAGLALPERELQQVYCPVYKDRVVSSKDPAVEYNGQTIYFYNHSAAKRWQTNPEKYLDLKLLPQLSQK